MRTIGVWALGHFLLLTGATFGQKDAAALRSSMYGRLLVLRSYSADSVTQYEWVDGKLNLLPVKIHGLEAFLDDSVKLKDGKIILSGSRVTLVRDQARLVAIGKSPMSLEVDLRGADPAAVLPQLQLAMFFDNPQSAIDGLPEPFADLLPFTSDGASRDAGCKCAHVYQDGAWVTIDPHSHIYSPPVVLTQSAPSSSEEAREAGVNGTVYLIFRITEEGRTDQIWLARPLGYGLDEAAASSVQGSRFRPAQLDGKPVATVSNALLNFQRY